MNGKRKFIIMFVLFLMVASIAGVGGYYWYQNTYYVATEDAKVTGDIVRVIPQVLGKLSDFKVEEGQKVEKDQVLASQVINNTPLKTTATINITSPISGLVIKKQGTVGETLAPGQLLAMLVDPNKLYITANIEETKLDSIKEGQQVDVTIDEYKNKKFSGRVSLIGQATNSTFSLLPSSTGSNFTKVVQKVPVKIELTNVNEKLLPGTNAIVKIHIK